MTDFTEAALELARQGVKVFPVGRDKKPHTPNGFHDATTKEEVIRAWEWKGMIAAAVSPGTIIIDVDPRNGGSETLKLYRDNDRAFPPTKIVRTKSGGFHYYFSAPEGVTYRGKLGPGIDVKRAGKGYVVVPPSPGYVLMGNEPQADAPEWLIDEITVPEAEVGASEASDAKFFPWEDGTPYGMAALERELGRLLSAPEGERNNTLNRAAFALSQLAAGGEISRKRAVKDLIVAAGRIGLDEKEVANTIESGWKSGEQVPRQARIKAEAVNVETFGQPVEQPWAKPRREPSEDESGIPEDADQFFWVDWTQDEPEPPYYLYNVIPKNAYVLVYGATEASKSMSLVGLGAQGSRLGYRFSIYSLENPPSTDRDRLRRLRPDPANFRLTNQMLDLNDPRQLEALVERERDWGDGRGTDVIIVDTYSHAFNSRSEDGNAKAIEFARRVRYVMAEVGCSFVVLDHTGYERDEPRDASAKRQQVDVAVYMKKSGEWRPGQPARFTMENKKAARFGNPFYLTGEIRDIRDPIRGLDIGWIGEQPKWVEPVEEAPDDAA